MREVGHGRGVVGEGVRGWVGEGVGRRNEEFKRQVRWFQLRSKVSHGVSGGKKGGVSCEDLWR